MPLLETIRAKAGATLLDIVRPGWADQVSPERLDLSDCQACVLGQLYGNYTEGVEKLFAMAENGTRYTVADRAGFDVVPGTTYSTLTKAWRREIEKRRNA